MGARIGFWSLVVVMTAIWAMGPFQQPPPSVTALAWFALVGWVMLPWAALADRGYQRAGDSSAPV